MTGYQSNHSILWVDDEPQVISSFERALHPEFTIVGARNGISGLQQLKKNKSFSVIVTDMTMPEMDGIQFLREVQGVYPEIVCIMLTGHQDQSTAVRATNEGKIFRYLTKPISIGAISTALHDAIKEYHINIEKKQLLDKTLTGSIRVLTDVIATIDPVIFAESSTARPFIEEFGVSLGVPHISTLILANTLSGIGLVSIPTHYLIKYHSGQPLSAVERKLFTRVPLISANLLSHIPRLEGVCRIMRFLGKNYDGTGVPDELIRGEDIPWGSRFLRIVRDLSAHYHSGLSFTESLRALTKVSGWYDPKILEEIGNIIAKKETSAIIGVSSEVRPEDQLIKLKVSEVKVGQRVIASVETTDGVLLLAAGEVITPVLLERIRNYSECIGVKEPIFVDCLEPICDDRN